MKKARFLWIVFFLITSNMHGQFLENDREILVANKVKSLTIVELFADSTCLHQRMEFDSLGNEVLYDLMRLEHFYKSVYDTSNHKIQELRIDRTNGKQVDSTFFAYDKHGSVIKETSVYYYGEERSEFVQQYRYEYDSLGNPLKKCQLLEEEEGSGNWREILLTEYAYNSDGTLKEVRQYMDEEVVSTEFYTYNADSLLIRKDVDDPSWFERVNMMRIKDRPDIRDQYVTYTYNDDKQIIEVYQYFSDDCLLMDNYHAYRYSYHSNGLISEIEVWEERKKMVSKVRFDYSREERGDRSQVTETRREK